MQPLWSRKIAAPPRGLALARERGWLLAWDAQHNLHLFNHAGEPQSRVQTPAPLTDATCADDGSCFAAGGAQGQVWLLAPDLTTRWERSVPQRCTAVALDPFGQYVAAADGGGGLTLFDRRGRSFRRIDALRPLRRLAFIPEAPALAASADFGLIACFDLDGRCLWRDGLVAHVGSLAVSGDGGAIALACFSEGLYCFSLDGPKRRQTAGVGPCRLAALSYDGDVLLTAGMDDKVHLRDGAGAIRGELSLDAAPAALVLGALGDRGAVALADRTIIGLQTG